jgi:hypothetical protein
MECIGQSAAVSVLDVFNVDPVSGPGNIFPHAYVRTLRSYSIEGRLGALGRYGHKRRGAVNRVLRMSHASGNAEVSGWSCSGCGNTLHIQAQPAGSPRIPCPHCGSTARTAHVSASVRASTQVYLKSHAKYREGGRKVVREEISGDDLFRKSGRWSIMRRLIDRASDWYEETFHDRDTGQIIHRKAEPLSQHRSPRRPR